MLIPSVRVNIKYFYILEVDTDVGSSAFITSISSIALVSIGVLHLITSN